MSITVTLVCNHAHHEQIQQAISTITTNHHLPLVYEWFTFDKVSQKILKQLNYAQSVILLEIDSNDQVVANLCQQNNNTLIKARLDWHKLQRRIVSAGRKSELLLQACKLQAHDRVLDATAGFGHDSLLMASTLSNLTLVEKNPITTLLLLLEQQRMQVEKNWLSLMKRLSIYHGDVLELKVQSNCNLTSFDLVYLDPMFPQGSYEGAKVGKAMQVLHELADPPSMNEEQALLATALSMVKEGGKVLVKRPKNAPYLGQVSPQQSCQNEALRFDSYCK